MPTKPELWIGLVEVRPFDRETYGAAGAFTNIVTWACSATEFRKKADIIAATLDLYVVDVEREEPLVQRADTCTISEEIEDMIQRAESNPDAIVYGTFHRYRVDQG